MTSNEQQWGGRLRKTGVGVVLLASLTIAPAAMSAASPGLAGASAPHTVSSLSATNAPKGSEIRVAPSAATGTVPAPAAPAAPAAAVDGAEKRFGWVKPVVNWIKNNAAGIWNGIKNAVKKGWNAFVKFWNGLAGWIKAGINFFVQGSLWEIFAGLRDYFF